MSTYQLNSNKFLSQDELEHLERLAKNSLASDTRNALAILLLLKTGARAQELLNINVTDLNDSSKSVFIRGIKNSYDREIPLAPGLYNELKKYAATVPTEKLFDFGYHRLIQIWDQYRPVKKKLHSLRHTAAVQLYQKSKDIRLVQTFLGHKNINNSLIYLQYVQGQDYLRKFLT